MTQMSQISAALRQQWAMLQERIGELTDTTLEQPSTLPGWTVRELIAHLARSLGLIDRCEILGHQNPAGHPRLLSLGDYLGGYAADSTSIVAGGRREAQRLGIDFAEAVSTEVERALRRLPQIVAAGDHGLIRTTRGVLTARDFLLTRVIELVVHADDLAPSVPAPAPVDPTALQIAAEALSDVLAERLGSPLRVNHEQLWVRTASGRLSWAHAEPQEPLLPEYLSDGIPDLSAYLPLL